MTDYKPSLNVLALNASPRCQRSRSGFSIACCYPTRTATLGTVWLNRKSSRGMDLASDHEAFPLDHAPRYLIRDRGGILGVEERPRFHEYVVHQGLPSYRYNDDFRVGAVLPESGVTYYEIPAEYRVQGYRYAYVNDHAVLVDPRTRRIVEIID